MYPHSTVDCAIGTLRRRAGNHATCMKWQVDVICHVWETCWRRVVRGHFMHRAWEMLLSAAAAAAAAANAAALLRRVTCRCRTDN